MNKDPLTNMFKIVFLMIKKHAIPEELPASSWMQAQGTERQVVSSLAVID